MMLTQITIITDAGGSQALTIQDFNESSRIVNWFENDIALSGKIRPNLRGAQGRYEISFRQCLEPSTYRSIINNIVSDLTGGEDSFTIIIDGDYKVVAVEDVSYLVSYSNQIGSFPPSIAFVDQELGAQGTNYVEDGYVTAGYVI